MTIATALDAVATLIRRADPAVTIGLPTANSAGLGLWAWRFVPVPSATVPPPRIGAPIAPRPMPFDLHLLVLPRSASSIDDIGALDRTLALIATTPVLRAADGAVRVTLSTGLADSSLVDLFAAARLPVSLCVELVARMTPD